MLSKKKQEFDTHLANLEVYSSKSIVSWMDHFLKKGGKRYVNRFRGFTLIELLIVVAIIGILAAIAIPNFLQAQIRAKVARVVSDVRTVDMACREYQVDQGAFIPSNAYALALNTGIPGDTWPTLALLTTPYEYLRGVSFDGSFSPERTLCQCLCAQSFRS
jgi:type II secretion system protein G